MIVFSWGVAYDVSYSISCIVSYSAGCSTSWYTYNYLIIKLSKTKKNNIFSWYTDNPYIII